MYIYICIYIYIYMYIHTYIHIIMIIRQGAEDDRRHGGPPRRGAEG